ncbi:hypothetical protein KKF82_07355 [Patescibacteria group bacterium]|nr:hypothetical protein [Patescibacteria group bacterium]
MIPNSIKVGNYEFNEFKVVEGGGQVRFEVNGKDGYILTEEDTKEITKILKYIGNWEKMVFSLNQIRINLETPNMYNQFKGVNIDDYNIDTEFAGARISRVACIYVRIHHKTDYSTPMENFWEYIQTAVKWKLLVDTLSNLDLRD